MDKGSSVEENIKQSFLSTSGYLFEEPGNLIKQECREPAQYNSIIRSIAGGASRLSEISGKAGLETALCSTYITKLISIGVIKKEYPFREETSRKTIYTLDDSMFRFWYRFIPGCMALIQRGEANLAYEVIKPQIAAYMGGVFEEICKQYLWRKNLAKQTPLLFTDAGRWWGNNPIKKEECEVDIIAANDDEAIFAECKWTNDPVGADVLNTLIARSELVYYREKYFYLFAKTGFTESVKERAESEQNITLVEYKDM